MSRSTPVKNVRNWHIKNAAPEEGYRPGEQWLSLSNATPEQALKLGTSVLGATTTTVFNYMGLGAEGQLMQEPSQDKKNFTCALISAALPFTRRVKEHTMETISFASLSTLKLCVSTEPALKVRRLQDLGYGLATASRTINLYDRTLFLSPDMAFEALLPAVLGELQ